MFIGAVTPPARGAGRARGKSVGCSPTRHTVATDPPPSLGSHLPVEGGLAPRREAGLDDFARCPVCGLELQTTGPDGVMVHLLAIHFDSSETHWVMRQLGVLYWSPPADSGGRDGFLRLAATAWIYVTREPWSERPVSD